MGAHHPRVGVWVCLLALTIVGLAPGIATAQEVRSEATVVDSAGNARGLDVDTVLRQARDKAQLGGTGIYQTPAVFNQTGRTAFGMDAVTAAAAGMRGGPLAMDNTMLGSGLLQPLPGFMDSYGGFGKRYAVREPLTLDSILRRRSSILAATSLNAPVKRANMGLGIMPRASSSLSGRMPAPELEELDPNATYPTLSEQMSSRVGVMFVRVRREAWALFSEGEYVQASRAFTSATGLVPNDIESHLGEIYCLTSVSCYRAAVVTLRQLARRGVNPFAFDINMTSRYRAPEEANEVQTRVGSFAQASGEPGGKALNAFVLWHMGKRAEAMSLAGTLAGGMGEESFADWPVLMRDALAALDATAEQP